MTQILASNNLLVDYDDANWRLIQTDDSEVKLIAEFSPLEGLRYNKYFASTRYLPPAGVLSADDISQIILGWSYETEAWQLGITLAPELASTRGSRWCELVRWTDPDLSIYEGIARSAASALASLLNKPFQDVPPAPAPEPEPIPLPELPLEIGIWKLDTVMTSQGLTSHQGELHFVRDKSWMNNKLGRVGWYSLWVVVYTFVSIATLTSKLALPNAGTLLPDPHMLPYLGLITMILLIGLVLQQLWHIRTEPDNIIINPYERTIIARRGRNVRWKVHANNLQSVYASEIIKKKDRKPNVYHSEINLHLVNGKFQHLLVEPDQIIAPHVRDSGKNLVEGVMPLDSRTASTDLQAAALYVAQLMGDLPTWYDLRFK